MASTIPSGLYMTQAFLEHDHAAPRENKVAPSTAHSSADAQPGLQQGAQRTRDRILQAARELVLEEGASRLTLDAVVVRAGLSKGRFSITSRPNAICS